MRAELSDDIGRAFGIDSERVSVRKSSLDKDEEDQLDK
jgi:hypothetical protein